MKVTFSKDYYDESTDTQHQLGDVSLEIPEDISYPEKVAIFLEMLRISGHRIPLEMDIIISEVLWENNNKVPTGGLVNILPTPPATTEDR